MRCKELLSLIPRPEILAPQLRAQLPTTSRRSRWQDCFAARAAAAAEGMNGSRRQRRPHSLARPPFLPLPPDFCDDHVRAEAS
ncbi:hypothetical protein Mapa_014713 [Marchantia paleacea]|nr:hypothetical protein Mapa_014713 [Marchantia paleacea]